MFAAESSLLSFVDSESLKLGTSFRTAPGSECGLPPRNHKTANTIVSKLKKIKRTAQRAPDIATSYKLCKTNDHYYRRIPHRSAHLYLRSGPKRDRSLSRKKAHDKCRPFQCGRQIWQAHKNAVVRAVENLAAQSLHFLRVLLALPPGLELLDRKR